jgi:hypothetical protein
MCSSATTRDGPNAGSFAAFNAHPAASSHWAVSQALARQCSRLLLLIQSHGAGISRL